MEFPSPNSPPANIGHPAYETPSSNFSNSNELKKRSSFPQTLSNNGSVFVSGPPPLLAVPQCFGFASGQQRSYGVPTTTLFGGLITGVNFTNFGSMSTKGPNVSPVGLTNVGHQHEFSPAISSIEPTNIELIEQNDRPPKADQVSVDIVVPSDDVELVAQTNDESAKLMPQVLGNIGPKMKRGRGRPKKSDITTVRPTGRPRGMPRKLIRKPLGGPKKVVAAIEALKESVQHFQSRIKDVVTIVKPYLNETAVTAIEALQDLEELASMDVINVTETTTVDDLNATSNVETAPVDDSNATVNVETEPTDDPNA